MKGYANAAPSQGLITQNAPRFHIFGGWEQYNFATLPRNNQTVIIKSGVYARIILGGSNGINDEDTLLNPTSHNFSGSSLNDSFVTNCIIDIETSTRGNYDYDINLLVGGACTGNTFSNSSLTLENGRIGRILGGSIGNSTYCTHRYVGNYPLNSYIGSSVLNLNGGTAAQVYGTSLGRVMSGSYICEVYYYGTSTINLAGTNVTGDVFGAGAGAVTGYNSTYSQQYGDRYGSVYSAGVTTKVTINMTSGTISGSLYGGGYGYTNYLSQATIANNGGSMYGDTEINISGGTINGNVFGGGCGYNWNKPALASMIGNSVINITGSPTINGDIFGAGNGIQNNQNIAKFMGTTTINIDSNLSHKAFG